ncbi:hypothetical protein [uncultured Eubacterium sp.]|uniref:hypothetical protein n=1 Tax=uncultured Eubacterium sp. TaxID=165185 RepID=UPI0025890324|nr:hypothetical protein [uncultured Eubacterium sp.]
MKLTLRKIDIFKYLFLYLIFQPTLPSLIKNEIISTFFNYTDEMIGVALVIIVLFKALKSEITLLKFERYMLIFMFIFEVIGIISGLIYKYQDTQYMLVDAYTCAKFFVFYLCARLLTQNKLTHEYFFSINGICKALAVIFFALSLHDAFLSPWFNIGDYRYFTYSVALFFEHPEFLARASMTIIFLLAYNYKYYKRNIYYILMLTVVMFLTFRTKAIVSIFVLFAVYLYFIKFRFKSLAPIGVITIAGATYFGYDSLSKYYIALDKAARRVLTNDSITIANQLFPIGSGFGSFGSSMAAQYYSRLYYKLGYNQMDGIGLGEGKKGIYLSDTFWPIIIAQTGWIGLISFSLALLSMLSYIIKSRKNDVYYFWVAISIIAQDLISSFAAPAFFYPSAMAPFLFLGLITSIHEFPKKQ